MMFRSTRALRAPLAASAVAAILTTASGGALAVAYGKCGDFSDSFNRPNSSGIPQWHPATNNRGVPNPAYPKDGLGTIIRDGKAVAVGYDGNLGIYRDGVGFSGPTTVSARIGLATIRDGGGFARLSYGNSFSFFGTGEVAWNSGAFVTEGLTVQLTDNGPFYTGTAVTVWQNGAQIGTQQNLVGLAPEVDVTITLDPSANQLQVTVGSFGTVTFAYSPSVLNPASTRLAIGTQLTSQGLSVTPPLPSLDNVVVTTTCP